MIIRTLHKKRDFTIIANECLRRDDLSARAKGLWAYLMTLPDDWRVHKSEVFSHFTEGRDAMQRAWNELVSAGYVSVKPQQSDSGQMAGWDVTVTEYVNQETDVLESRGTGNPYDGEATPTKDLFLPKTDLPKTNAADAAMRGSCNEVIDYLNTKTGKAYRHTEGNRSHIRARLREGFTIDDCRRVIDTMVAEWKGTDMDKYLRFKTLFAGKFEDYLNRKPPKSDGLDDYEQMPDGTLAYRRAL